MTKRLCNSKLCARPFACQVGIAALAPLPSHSRGTEHVILCPHWKRWRPTTKIQRCHKGRISSLPSSFPSPTFSPTSLYLAPCFSNPARATEPTHSILDRFALPTRRLSESATSIPRFAPAVNSVDKAIHPATLHPRPTSPTGSIGTDFPPKPPLRLPNIGHAGSPHPKWRP